MILIVFNHFNWLPAEMKRTCYTRFKDLFTWNSWLNTIYTFLIFIKRRPVRTGLAVATLRALCQTLALRMPLTIRTIAKANSELSPAATCLSALAPVAPVAPAICRNKHKRKPNECKNERSNQWWVFLTSNNVAEHSIPRLDIICELSVLVFCFALKDTFVEKCI